MTNSTPKNNRIERQGSPNGKKWTPQSRKSVTYFASSASKEVVASLQQNGASAVTTTATKKQTPTKSCSPSNIRSSQQQQQQPIPRLSPVRHDSPRGSPTNNFYAGAKFSEPPSPAMLPKPPSHWTGLRMRAATTCGQENARCAALMLPCNITQHFSKIISVSA